MIADIPHDNRIEIVVENDEINNDTDRTAAWGVGCRRWGVVALGDLSMVTLRNSVAGAGERADVLTAVAGPDLGSLALCVGVQVSGNLGGEKLQNTLHRAVGAPIYHDWTYDPLRVDPVLHASWSSTFARASATVSPFMSDLSGFIDFDRRGITVSPGIRAIHAQRTALRGSGPHESGVCLQITVRALGVLLRAEIRQQSYHIAAGITF